MNLILPKSKQRLSARETAALATVSVVFGLALLVGGCAEGPGGTAPSFSRTADDQTYTVGEAIRPLTLPPATGGNGTLSYALRPTVPGLTFDPGARTLTGTPTHAATYAMTYTVTDEDGNTSNDDADMQAFTMIITASVPEEHELTLERAVSSVSVGDINGVLRPGPLPTPSGGGDISVSANDVVIGGGTFNLEITSESDDPADTLYMALEGGSGGHYEIDLSSQRSADRRLLPALYGGAPVDCFGRVRQTLTAHRLDPPRRPDRGYVGSFTLAVSAGYAGRISPPAYHTFDVIEVGTGEVQVSLSWNTDSDVDLHVVDPNGDEVFYGNRRVSSGGELDLDSNAGCGIDGIRNENITWPEGGAPSGMYVVRVDYWSSCGVSETDYTVRVNYGANSQVYTGTFTGRGDYGGAGSGVQVATFSFGQ